jgi:1-acyl-sn-glycerol-3-phosphate acyltransferase
VDQRAVGRKTHRDRIGRRLEVVRVRREKGGIWVGLAAVVFYPIGFLTGRTRYSGRAGVPATGGVLVVANHISYLDPLHTALWVHTARRVPRFLAKSSLWKIPVFGRVLVGSGQIPVYRDSADAQNSLRAGIRALQEGKVVVIYPEGTITRDPDGWPMHARTGVARLALGADVPVIPVVHWGTREVYDHYGKRFRPLPRRDIVVRAGSPVDLSDYRDRPVDAGLLREVTDLLMARVRELLAEVRGEPAPAEFFRPGGAA